MRLRDVHKLKVGDYIELKHNLGMGTIIEVVWNEHRDRPGLRGRFPMVNFKDKATGAEHWTTYLHIDVHNNTVRSVST